MWKWSLLLHDRIENIHCCKCQKQPLEVFCKKRCSLKCHKIHRKLLCQRKHLRILQNFSGQFFKKNISGQLLLKCRNCNNKVRDILDCICCRELDAMLTVSAENVRVQGKHVTTQLLSTSDKPLITCISLI